MKSEERSQKIIQLPGVAVKSEKELDSSQLTNLMEHIFNNVIDGIIVFDRCGKILEVNPSMCESIHRDREEIIGATLEELVPEEKHFKIKKQWEILSYKNNVKGFLPIIHKEGVSTFEFTTSVLSPDSLYVSVLRDVTEKRVLEKNVKKNADLYQDLFLESLDAIVFWDSDTKVINANNAACKLFECSMEQLKMSRLSDFIYKKDKKYFETMKELKVKGNVREEFLFIMANGQKKYIEFTAKLHAVEDYHMTIFRNVTERYKMEQDLRESEQKFRNIFEGALEGILLWNDQFRIVDINESGAKLLQTTKDQLINESLINVLTNCKITKEELKEQLMVLEDQGQSIGNVSITLSSGKVKHFECSTKRNVFSNLSMTVFKDITEKLELEEQLHKSDTLNVIGQLAAGIAHEIRNPMTALKGFIQLLEDTITKSNSMYFNVISTELDRIDSIINEFLILAKPQAVKYIEQDIVQIMRETIDLLNAQAVLHNIQFRTNFAANLPKIYCEPNQLKKVFINIIKNAIEVMYHGGYVTVTIEQTVDEKLRISIRDEGMGIPADKIKKLGEPFYTTKERGTGLGLMVTYRIIEDHHGTIDVESEIGIGTIFHISLPIRGGRF